MVEIIALKTPTHRPPRATGEATAQILWFTGVRYTRFESVEDLPSPPPQRTPKPRRRSRRSAVCA